MLAYYRNHVVHVFLNEAYIASSLISFGAAVIETEGVPISRLKEKALYLSNYFRPEFAVRHQMCTDKYFFKHLEVMQQRRFIAIKDEKVMLGEIHFAVEMLSDMIGAFIETALVTHAFLLTMQMNPMQMQLTVFQQKIQSMAEQFFDEKVFKFYESCSMDAIENSLMRFKSSRIVEVFKKKFGREGIKEMISLTPEGMKATAVRQEYEELLFFKPAVVNHKVMNKSIE